MKNLVTGIYNLNLKKKKKKSNVVFHTPIKEKKQKQKTYKINLVNRNIKRRSNELSEKSKLEHYV